MTESVPDCWNCSQKDKLYLLTWTTTPWSIVANKAVAFKPGAPYVLLKDNHGDKYILAQDLLEKSEEIREIFSGKFTILQTFQAEQVLNQVKYRHPLDHESVNNMYPGSHVTLEQGTGLVHTAPAHGQEDYLLGLQHNLDLSCPVNELGQYDCSVNKNLRGLEVLSRGTLKVLELLHDQDAILKQSKFIHSYPYDWRTKKPVILRGSKQWFMDTGSLQARAIEFLKHHIQIEPKSMSKAFESVLQNRPYWCISRQRVWGVPIPVFYSKDDAKQDAITNQDIIAKLCDLIDKTGSIDFWWSMSEKEILKGTFV